MLPIPQLLLAADSLHCRTWPAHMSQGFAAEGQSSQLPTLSLYYNHVRLKPQVQTAHTIVQDNCNDIIMMAKGYVYFPNLKVLSKTQQDTHHI